MPRRLTLVQLAFRPSSANLGRRVVDGAAFTFLGIAIRVLITIGSMAILARLLTPADFGHVAMATVVTELAALFSNFGFGSILIQRPRIARIQIDTMFWAALGLGVALTALVFLFSFPAGKLFNDALVGQLLQVLCISFVLEELTVVPRSLLARMLMFRTDFVVQAAMLLCRAGTAVAMALAGWGVWSLVGGALAGALVQTAAYAVVVGYRPRLRFSKVFLASTWRINGGYFGNGILFYVNSNLDLFLVGRLLGAVSLGYYQNARSLTDEVRTRMAIPLQRVLFPAFSAVQGDLERFRAGILRSGRLLALVVIPIGFGIAAVAEELVPLLYGAQWLAMIPLLKIISMGSGIRAATTIGSPIFNATNRLGLSFHLYLASTLASVAALFVGSRWGLLGVAYAILFSALIALLFFRVALGLVRMGTRDEWRILGVPCVASLLMLFAVMLARDPVYAATEALSGRLAALVLLGALTYAAGVLLMSRSYLRDVHELFRHFRRA